MSAALATEAENANQIATESAVVAPFNVDIVAKTDDTKGFTDVEPNGTDAIPPNASTEAGATVGATDEKSFAGSQTLEASTMQESVEDTDANTRVPSFKGNSDVLTGEQAVNQEVGEEKEHVPVEEKAYEAGYTYPSSTEPIPDEDAPEVTSTITPDKINASISSAAGDATSSAPPAPESLSDVVPVSSSAAAALGAEESELISTDAAEAKLVEDTVQDTHTNADDSKVYLPEATVRVTGDDLVPDSQVSEDNGVDGAAETTFIDPISTAPNMADDSLQEVGFGEAEEPPRATVVSDDVDPVVSDQIIQGIDAQEEPETKDEPTNPVAEDQTEQGPTEITEENLSADTDASQLLTTHESELERPKSPWTPSYSVTTQGPGIPTSDEVDVADLPVLPPPVVQLVASLDEHPRSDPVLAQIEPTVTVTNVQDEVEVPPLSDPPRPWTPSYSVVVQGSPLSTPVDLADPDQAAIATEHVDSLGLTQEEVKDEPNLDMPNSVMTSLIESGVIVDPSTLRDPDVEDVPLDPGSEAAVVAALLESGVLGHDAKEDELPIPVLLSSTAAQEETEASAVSDGDDQLLVAPEVEITDDIPASEKMTLSQVPEIETLLTTAQSEPERPKSPWTPSYSVTQQGRVSSDGKPEEAPVPVSEQEMFSAEQPSFIESVVGVSTLETSLESPRASSPWTPSYSVSVQGSPLPVQTELTEPELLPEADSTFDPAPVDPVPTDRVSDEPDIDAPVVTGFATGTEVSILELAPAEDISLASTEEPSADSTAAPDIEQFASIGEEVKIVAAADAVPASEDLGLEVVIDEAISSEEPSTDIPTAPIVEESALTRDPVKITVMADPELAPTEDISPDIVADSVTVEAGYVAEEPTVAAQITEESIPIGEDVEIVVAAEPISELAPPEESSHEVVAESVPATIESVDGADTGNTNVEIVEEVVLTELGGSVAVDEDVPEIVPVPIPAIDITAGVDPEDATTGEELPVNNDEAPLVEDAEEAGSIIPESAAESIDTPINVQQDASELVAEPILLSDEGTTTLADGEYAVSDDPGLNAETATDSVVQIEIVAQNTDEGPIDQEFDARDVSAASDVTVPDAALTEDVISSLATVDTIVFGDVTVDDSITDDVQSELNLPAADEISKIETLDDVVDPTEVLSETITGTASDSVAEVTVVEATDPAEEIPTVVEVVEAELPDSVQVPVDLPATTRQEELREESIPSDGVAAVEDPVSELTGEGIVEATAVELTTAEVISESTVDEVAQVETERPEPVPVSGEETTIIDDEEVFAAAEPTADGIVILQDTPSATIALEEEPSTGARDEQASSSDIPAVDAAESEQIDSETPPPVEGSVADDVAVSDSAAASLDAPLQSSTDDLTGVAVSDSVISIGTAALESAPPEELSEDVIALDVVTIKETVNDSNNSDDATVKEPLAVSDTPPTTSTVEESNTVINPVAQTDHLPDVAPADRDTTTSTTDETAAVPDKEVADAPPIVLENASNVPEELVEVASADDAVPLAGYSEAPAADRDSTEPSISADSGAEIDTEEPVNEATPVASAVPLPAELPLRAFPTILDIPHSADTDEDADALDAPPISPRSRLESTASSIFFTGVPGGWFSKIPVGRASLDVAQGEFTSKPASPSIHSPVNEVEQGEEKKGKWCVVM